MPEKIIIVGPPNAGKTTLRKIFFEGENSIRLLEETLDPTHGKESLLFSLGQDIGIFDLAGQENERWLEGEERDVFLNSKVILIVIDAETEPREMVTFTGQIQEIRKDLTPNTTLHLLVHKIDLLGKKQLKDLKMYLNNELHDISNLHIHYTSIKKDFFLETFSIFVDLLEEITGEEEELFEVEFLDVVINLLYQMNKVDFIPINELSDIMNEPQEIVNKVVDYLTIKEFIVVKKIHDQDTVSLSELGKTFFKKMITSFSLETDKEDDIKKVSEQELRSLPPLLGFLLSDKDGKLLMSIESQNDLLKRSLRENLKENIQPIDLDLVPMFISALEKFSQEINIHDLSGFTLRGTNQKLYIFGYDLFTVTFFINPNLNIKPIENEIRNYFSENFKKYRKELTLALRTGDITALVTFQNQTKKWFDNLNSKCREMIINIDLFDLETAKKLYGHLDEIQQEIILNTSLAIERVKKLKVDITKAIVNQDINEIKVIAQKGQTIKNKFI